VEEIGSREDGPAVGGGDGDGEQGDQGAWNGTVGPEVPVQNETDGLQIGFAAAV
jgi:hypothetical protein